MKVDGNITVYAQSGQYGTTYAAKPEEASNEEKKALFVGDMKQNSLLNDRIMQKKAMAQKKAMKVVRDAWDGDRKVDDELIKRKEHINDMRRSSKEAQDTLIDLKRQSEEIKKAYNIEDDSQEQKDLELLVKYKKDKALSLLTDKYNLTPEESGQLTDMAEGGLELTEYQRLQLQLASQAVENERLLLENKRDTIEENYVIRGIRQERRKIHPMIDAQDKADAIMEAAGRDIIGMVVDDAKEHLDKEQEERKEDAQEVREKKEEQQEFIEKQKEKNEEQEELAEELLFDQKVDASKVQTGAHQEVQEIVNQMEMVALEVQEIFDDMDLLVEDIKGAMIDINL